MKRLGTYIKTELIFVIKWNITLPWMILAFTMYFMLIFQWTVIVLIFYIFRSLKMIFTKLLSQINIQKIPVRLIKLCREIYVLFYFLFTVSKICQYLVLCKISKSYSERQKGSQNAHMLDCQVRIWIGWKLGNSAAKQHWNTCAFPRWQVVKRRVKACLLFCLCSKLTCNALTVTERHWW